jgi:uncharacterized protein YjbI with pentapeptide repeats
MTTPDTPAKKLVSVEILHLDKTGYGPEGKHTRHKWRAECLDYFEQGAAAFLAWQKSWQYFADQNKLKADFDVLRTFDDGSIEKLGLYAPQSHCLDFLGHIFNLKDEDDYQDYKDYQFLNRVCFIAATFTGYADFSVATFTDYADFRKTTFMFDAYFRGTTFASEANFDETTFTSDADFNETTFTSRANFNKSNFIGHANFSKITFKGYAEFNGVTFTDAEFTRGIFTGYAEFSKATFTGYAEFSNATFKDRAMFHETIFTGDAWFSETIFTGFVKFSKTTFAGQANFSEVTFRDDASFYETTFTGNVSFDVVIFEKLTRFVKAKFYSQINFRKANFKDAADFENAEFANVGHFEGATFNAPTSKIPSFRGVDLGGTSSLEFSDDTHFTPADFDEEAVKNIAFLKHLSEQHGQIDQALNFNAMELRAKYLLVVEPLREKSLPWFKRTFQRFRNSAWWALRLTWLYWKASNFGRSYLLPLVWYAMVYGIALSFALSCAALYKPQNCSYNQIWNVAGLLSTTKPTIQKANKIPKETGTEDGQLPLNGYQAAFEYANYHATGLVDFTGDSKLKDAITQRVFGVSVKPWWARLIGALLSIINTALLFLIALGLRNSYRLK